MEYVPESTPIASAVKPNPRALTTTSYAILGLLSLRRWSGYELTQQMRRSLRFHWPRAESRVYMEGPNLVAHGLAESSEDHHGARKRTLYSITGKGRAALRAWLAEPSAPARLESEALVRSMFAESGTKEDLLRTLRELDEQARAARAQLLEQGVDYLAAGGPFPARLHLIALNGRFLLAFTQLLSDWARWAIDEVRTWEDTGPIEPERDAIAVFRHVIGPDLLREIEEAAPREER
jgi:PadR family transcriptional regulator, regulatory protein AphA